MKFEYRNRSQLPYWIPYSDTTVEQDQQLGAAGKLHEFSQYEISLGRPASNRSGSEKIKYIKQNHICARLWIELIAPYHGVWLDYSRTKQAENILEKYEIGYKEYIFMGPSIGGYNVDFPKGIADPSRIYALRCCDQDLQVLFKLTTGDINWLSPLW